MKEKILLCIQDSVKEHSIELCLDSVLAESIDSIAFVKMIVALEIEFNFEFEDDMLSVSNNKKVEDLVKYVESRLGS